MRRIHPVQHNLSYTNHTNPNTKTNTKSRITTNIFYNTKYTIADIFEYMQTKFIFISFVSGVFQFRIQCLLHHVQPSVRERQDVLMMHMACFRSFYICVWRSNLCVYGRVFVCVCVCMCVCVCVCVCVFAFCDMIL